MKAAFAEFSMTAVMMKKQVTPLPFGDGAPRNYDRFLTLLSYSQRNCHRFNHHHQRHQKWFIGK